MPNINDESRYSISDVPAAHMAELEKFFEGYWPETWREIARSVFIALLIDLGGKELPPVRLARAAVVSLESIVAHLGGSQPYISTRSRQREIYRRAAILEELRKGDSYNEVARRHGTTERTVRQIEETNRLRMRQTCAQGNASPRPETASQSVPGRRGGLPWPPEPKKSR
ncbi:MAG: helix-turn-helix domain-containing protein [Rubrivivax sp.]